MKKKRKNKALPLLVLLCVLLLLLAGYFGLKKLNEAAENGEESTEDTSEQVSLFEGDKDSLTEISYSYEGQQYTFVKEDDVWINQEEPEIELNQNLMSSMAGNITSLTSERIVGDVTDNLSDYGLAEPETTVTFKVGEDTGSWQIGAENDIAGGVYIKKADENTVYLVSDSFKSAFQKDMFDLLEDEEMPEIGESDITDIQVQNPSGTVALTFLEEGNDNDLTGMLSWFYTDENQDYAGADEDVVSSITSEIAGLSMGDCVSYKADASMADFGLDQPQGVVLVDYTQTYEKQEETSQETSSQGETASTQEETTASIEETAASQTETAQSETQESSTEETEAETITVELKFRLEIGSQTEDGDYYCRYSDSDRVYLLAQDTAETFLNLTNRDLVDKNPALINISTVDRLVITYNGSQTEYTIERTTQTDEEGNETTETVYRKDGEEMEEDTFKDLYQEIVGITAEAVISEEQTPVEGDPELSFTFYRNTENHSQVTISYTPFDSDFYQMTIDGTTQLLVNKRDIQALEAAIAG